MHSSTNMDKKTILTQHYHSPCGTLLLGDYGDKLCLCDWMDSKRHLRNKQRISRLLHAHYEETCSRLLKYTIHQLDDYFLGKRKRFDIPVLFVGSEFQCNIWETLQTISYGTTSSYLAIAQSIQKPRAVRAVANAIGANAISIIVPCHRVVGSNGSLAGYAGGIEAKKTLLTLETRHDNHSNNSNI